MCAVVCGTFFVHTEVDSKDGNKNTQHEGLSGIAMSVDDEEHVPLELGRNRRLEWNALAFGWI